ncbi:hypothetical protein [Candidatus Tisiphia endosymbiont of Empis tessellata]|uniref:hypothetical protein n=1 Tax=Candidatus Tisiphia endosymbiont of Empis tessellata TaxID=3066259 RepID=UPI00313D1310
MCKAIKAASNTVAIDCVKEFAETKHSSLLPTNKKEHKDLLVKIVTMHPEYFCTIEIAEVAIKAAIPKNIQKQKKLLTIVFNELIKNIDNIEIALRGNIDELHNKVSSNGMLADIKELFSEEFLEKVLKKDYFDGYISSDEMINAQKIMFKHMCEVTTQNNLSCVQGFVQEHPALLIKIAGDNIVRDSITDSILQEAVLASINPTGRGCAKHQEDNYWHDYWYKYSKKVMDQILELYLKSAGIKDAKIISADCVFDDASKFDFVKNLLAKIPVEFAVSDNVISDSISGSNNITKLLIPINLYNKHWVGLALKHSLDKIIAYYMDSENRTMPKTLKSSFEVGLAKLYPNLHIEITEQQVQSQKYNNCGPEVIENFIAICGGIRVTEEEALDIHSLLFEDSVLKQELIYPALVITLRNGEDNKQFNGDNVIYNLAETSTQCLLSGEEGMLIVQ